MVTLSQGKLWVTGADGEMKQQRAAMACLAAR